MSNPNPLNLPLPYPSFEDVRKILEFWFDQENKWFYFEIASIQSGSNALLETEKFDYGFGGSSRTKNNEINIFLQDRIVGKIKDVVTYPPSLLLENVTIFTTKIAYAENITTALVSTEKREEYGLIFSQITYYEPILKITSFLSEDKRINLNPS